ncbi:MAG: zf-HC2 domain-containing protein [Nitriliruptorales bacterium]|nr:zf-HC2 domain-containing protein [Nitriliruptorales bacterium]
MKSLLRRFFAPPDCREVQKILQSYLDGELPESEHHKVAEHLEHCDRCGIEAEVYREVKRSLGRLHQPPDPTVMERLRSYTEDLTGEAGGP